MNRLDAPTIDERMMRRCFALAENSTQQGEYPYGAIITRSSKVLAEATNCVARDRDVTRHAEVVAISEAQEAIGSTSLDDCTIYSNVEPCAFCSYAIRESRIARVVYAIPSPIMGGASRWNILGDLKLSDTMPEVFAPPPDIVPGFLYAEADAMLRRNAPITWAFLRAKGLLIAPAPRIADADCVHLDPIRPSGPFDSATGRLMRVLRRNVFDRFGRGGRS